MFQLVFKKKRDFEPPAHRRMRTRFVATVIKTSAKILTFFSFLKLSSCPSCRKPLPRCSLCLMHMGTTLGLSLQNPTGHACYGWQSKPFSKWFSWCQSCRHGGHTEHLTQWFSQHLECPVASCTCRCFTLDFSVPEANKETVF